ncbi:MAG: hypothetical protein CMO81_09655 [Waddliaceae bacterium]|nr:hypothetical protein [Waddliaceae bacterium]|tara:strand:+ start:73 stop:402 length:330 start_codon:yes stop_codon:yes gene_type:complete
MSLGSADALKGICAKIFIGVYLNSELNMHLRNSSTWQQVLILPNQSEQALCKSTYQDREYLGFFIDHGEPTLDQIKEWEQSLRDSLKTHCPDLIPEQLDVKLFSQVFLS